MLNWVIQGAVVAVATAAWLRVIPLSLTRARYGFVWAAYVLVLALPIVPSAVAAVASDVLSIDAAPVPGPFTMPSAWWTSAAIVGILWIIWSVAHGIRLATGAAAVRAARRESDDCPSAVLTPLPHWSQAQATGRRARV